MDVCNYSTAWGLILYGTDGEHRGADPVAAIRIESCSKELFSFISSKKETEPYWERSVKVFFQICENDYKFKVIACWKDLFRKYSRETFEIKMAEKSLIQNPSVKLNDEEMIEKIVVYCHKIYESATTFNDHKKIFEVLAPYKEHLMKAHSNADAQFFLGYCYSFGHGVFPLLARALEYYQLSADQGQDMAQICLGYNLHHGIGVQQDLEEAIKYFEKSADSGNSLALRNLGYCYLEGLGVNVDLSKAFTYTKMGADRGDAGAQSNLGYFYKDGIGTKVDLTKAFTYTQMAADQGNADAKGNLGFLYTKGIGTDKNLKKALEYTQMSVDEGNIDVQINLDIIKKLLEQEKLNGL